MIIGLTGTIGAGKSIIAEFLKKKGFYYFSLSNELREIARNENIELTRENLQNLGNKTRHEKSTGYLAELIAGKINSNSHANAVIDGIRNPAEVEALRKLKDFKLVSIDANEEIRFKRLQERNREKEAISRDDFLKVNARDLGEDDLKGQQTRRCMELADVTFVNEQPLEEIQKKLEELYNKLNSSNQ